MPEKELELFYSQRANCRYLPIRPYLDVVNSVPKDSLFILWVIL